MTTKIVTVTRLTPDVYRSLEKQCPQPGDPQDGIKAGFLLGVQFVLKKLRDGFTIEEQGQ